MGKSTISMENHHFSWVNPSTKPQLFTPRDVDGIPVDVEGKRTSLVGGNLAQKFWDLCDFEQQKQDSNIWGWVKTLVPSEPQNSW
jgi:hypothetical protein